MIRKLIQFTSDLHLEKICINKIDRLLPHLIRPNAKNCVLAGDICQFTQQDKLKKLLQYCSQNFNKTYYISGNHEYYNDNKYSMFTLDQSFYNLIEEQGLKNKIIFLNNKKVDIENGYKIIGTTLWSDIPTFQEDPDIYNSMKFSSWNYKYIYDDNYNTIEPSYTKQLFEDNLNFILRSIDEEEFDGNSKLIIASHHPPLDKGTSDYYYENTNCPRKMKFRKLFINDLKHILLNDNYSRKINTWIFGHTHYRCDFIYNGVRIVSHPNCKSIYNKNKQYNIDLLTIEPTIGTTC